MTKENPVFFIDAHSEYQSELDFEIAASQGYKAAIIKSSQGESFVPQNFGNYFKRARRDMEVMGAYHFLDSTGTGRGQAKHFLDTLEIVGGPQNKILVVDFEMYGGLSASNKALINFIDYVKENVGENQPMVVYSARNFWKNDSPSGPLDNYGENLHAWDAAYLDMAIHKDPQDYYQIVNDAELWKKWGLVPPWGIRWGGVEPVAWQFTSTGIVAGQKMDVNAFRKPLEALRSLRIT